MICSIPVQRFFRLVIRLSRVGRHDFAILQCQKYIYGHVCRWLWNIRQGWHNSTMRRAPTVSCIYYGIFRSPLLVYKIIKTPFSARHIYRLIILILCFLLESFASFPVSSFWIYPIWFPMTQYPPPCRIVLWQYKFVQNEWAKNNPTVFRIECLLKWGGKSIQNKLVGADIFGRWGMLFFGVIHISLQMLVQI